MHSLPPIYYIVFTAVTALAVLLQTLVLLAIFLAMRKSLAKLHEVTDEVKEQAMPVLASTRSLLEDISPKLKTATGNLAEVSYTLRHQANRVNETVNLLLDRTNTQIRRVDELVTGTFNAVDLATKTIESAVAAPARRVSGVIHGVRAGMEVLMGRKRNFRSNRTGTDDTGFPE